MIHRIYSDLPGFKNLEFQAGLNILLAERHQQSTDLQTCNGAGKSSLIQLIHFLLGGKAGPDSIFRNAALENAIFGMEFDLGPSQVITERQGKTQNQAAILKGTTAGWPIQPSLSQDIGRSLSMEEWRSVLGQIWFGLKSDLRYQPSFRSLISYFVRRDASIENPQAHSKKQTMWDQQVAVACLLGLSWIIGSEWQVLRDREKSLAELRSAAKQGTLGDVISTSAQLRTQLVIAEQAAKRVQESLESFEVLPEYRELEREANDLTKQIGSMSNENIIDEETIKTIQTAVEDENVPTQKDIERLYSEAGVLLPGLVKKRFQEVENFHASIVANRRYHLQEELRMAEQRLEFRRQQMIRLDARRAEIVRLLQSRGALDQFQQLQQEAAKRGASVETLRQRLMIAQQVEGVTSQLRLERSRIRQQLQRDLIEHMYQVNEAISIFEEVSNALYEEAGSLTLAAGKNGLEVEIQIQGYRSDGIRKMQIFCFDMMLMRLSAKRGIGPRFLVHDSHLFDGVDERQIAKALQIGNQTAQACNWQYIVTMNADVVPKSFPPTFYLKEYILPVQLSDQREDGGLFGLRFN